VSEIQHILLSLLLIFVMALIIGRWRVGKWMPAEWRVIPAFDRLSHAVQRAIERGRALHLALGRGALWSSTATDSLAGVEALRSIAEHLSLVGQMPLVTTGDATLQLLAEDSVHRIGCRNKAGFSQAKPDVRWLTATPAAYAAGVMDILKDDTVEANAMIGFFGTEYLLMGEPGAQRAAVQVGGASEPTVLPFVLATSRAALLGEELYAVGAYLAHNPWHAGSLWAQDVVRWLIVLLVLVAVMVNTLV